MADILVVEDDPDVADSLTSVLEDEGHNVRIARNGQEALASVDDAMPDVVLLDVEMPVLDGPDAAYQLFVISCGKEKIPIVLLPGTADLGRIAEQVGTPHFHAKPYRIDALLGLLDRVFLERRAPVPAARRCS